MNLAIFSLDGKPCASLRMESDSLSCGTWLRAMQAVVALELNAGFDRVSFEVLDVPADLSGSYWQLVLAVESKHEGESRFETALRYIRERETAIPEEGVGK